MDDQGIRIPVHLDVSGIQQDLRAIDPELRRLEQRLVRAFNQSDLVGSGPTKLRTAKNVEDVQQAIRGFNPTQLQTMLPRLAQAQAQLQSRMEALDRQAKAGRGVLPPTESQLARQRLQSVENRNQPVGVEFTQRSMQEFKRAIISSGPNLAGMALSRGGVGGATGIARLLSRLALENPELGLLVGGLGVTGAAAAGVSENQANFARMAAAIRSTMTGGPSLGAAPALRTLGLMNIAQGFNFDLNQGARSAGALSMGGVSGHNLPLALSSMFALARASGMAPDDLAQMTAQLGGAGGLSGQGLNQTFQDVLNQGATSVAKLVDAMKALSGTAAVAATDVSGLSAVQRLVGGNVNAGALLAPALSSTGATALQQGALLGLGPQQFTTAQAHPAVMFDRIARLVRRVNHGPAGVDVAEQLLSSSGLLNTANMNPQQLATLIRTMSTGSPQQAETAAARILATTEAGRQEANKWLGQIAANTAAQTSGQDRLGLAINNALTSVFNRVGTPQYNTSGAFRYVPGAVQATGPLPGDTTSTLPSLSGVHLGNMMIPNGAGGFNRLPASLVPQYQAGAQTLAAATGMSYQQALALLLAQGSRESGFNPNARSGAGALGIAQFMPATAKAYGLTNPLDSRSAILAQARYDADLYQRAGGNIPLALAMYNGGTHPNAQAQAYGASVYDAAQQVTVNVEVTDRTTSGITATVNPQRTVVGHKSHLPPRHH